MLIAALLASLTAGAASAARLDSTASDSYLVRRDADPPGSPPCRPCIRHCGTVPRFQIGWPKNRLRFIRSSSASLPPSVMRDLEIAFGVPVIEAYGMTEAAHQMASNPLPPHGGSRLRRDRLRSGDRRMDETTGQLLPWTAWVRSWCATQCDAGV